MSEFDDLRLAELLCARICHDLSGPVGGAVAGVELLSDTESPEGDDIRLLADAVGVAAAHLKFLRAALGHGSAPFAAGEAEALCRLLIDGSKWRLAWAGLDAEVPRPLGKLVLVLVLVARDALSRGGEISVRPLSEARGVEVLASGQAAGGDELLSGFDASVSVIGPRGALARYAVRSASAAGCTIGVERGEKLLRFTVLTPSGS